MGYYQGSELRELLVNFHSGCCSFIELTLIGPAALQRVITSSIEVGSLDD